MKLIKKVDRIEVKRCFCMTYYMRKYGIARKTDFKIPSKEKYVSVLKKSKDIVKNLNEKQLDKIVGEYKKRLRFYNSVDWYLAEVSVIEVGVWKSAGGLPKSWTIGSVFETARMVKGGLKDDSVHIKKRSKRAIPAIIKLKSIIKKEKLLNPIVFEAGFGTNGRKGLTKLKGDIDDGNMRAIALTISGDKKFMAYFGKKIMI